MTAPTPAGSALLRLMAAPVAALLGRIRSADPPVQPDQVACADPEPVSPVRPAMERPRPLMLTISRSEIDALEVGPALARLEGWGRTSASALESRGRVRLAVHGYAGGPAELSRIETVRDYFSGLMLAFPAWFFFADPQGGALPLLAMCTCRTHGTAVHPDDLRPFVSGHLAALRVYGEQVRLAEDETEAMGRAAMRCLAPSPPASR